MINYLNLITLENLFQAWDEFKIGKRARKDVQVFERHLEDNLFYLYQKLKDKTYTHGSYQSFYVQDPKRRHIHKATVPDRIVHHLLYKYLYALFDSNFIHDSYSCRLDKGTHKGVRCLEQFTRIVSKNYTQSCWALKLDIKKFFASVDHRILLSLIKNKVMDEEILWLLENVISSFSSDQGAGHGIPLGNLTSQIFANMYMNELDQFVKHRLKIKYYLRYADDFILLSKRKEYLEELLPEIDKFLIKRLKINLHEKKIIFRKYTHGIDFLGYVVLPHCILPRTKTKRRIIKKLREKIRSDSFEQSLQSYIGYLSHANAFKLSNKLINDAYLAGTLGKNII